MENQTERAISFKNYHIKGSPLILFNIWDAGSVQVIQETGAKAIATGSWSVSAAHGFSKARFGMIFKALTCSPKIDPLRNRGDSYKLDLLPVLGPI